MVSCRMFMLALHTIWRFCLSNIVSLSARGLGGITEYRTYFLQHHPLHNHRQFTGNFPYTPMYPVNRPRAKDNDEPAELPARPTL